MRAKVDPAGASRAVSTDWIISARSRTRSGIDLRSEALNTNICVSSFFEAGDLLSQWRGYCAQGAGFSIGFDAQKLRELGRAQGFSLVRCEYDPDVSRKKIESYIEEEIQKNPRDHSKRTSAWQIAERLATYCAGIKHISFAEEREWRLVSDMIHSQIRILDLEERNPSLSRILSSSWLRLVISCRFGV